MKVYSFYIKALLVCHAIILASCTDYVAVSYTHLRAHET